MSWIGEVYVLMNPSSKLFNEDALILVETCWANDWRVEFWDVKAGKCIDDVGQFPIVYAYPVLYNTLYPSAGFAPQNQAIATDTPVEGFEKVNKPP